MTARPRFQFGLGSLLAAAALVALALGLSGPLSKALLRIDDNLHGTMGMLEELEIQRTRSNGEERVQLLLEYRSKEPFSLLVWFSGRGAVAGQRIGPYSTESTPCRYRPGHAAEWAISWTNSGVSLEPGVGQTVHLPAKGLWEEFSVERTEVHQILTPGGQSARTTRGTVARIVQLGRKDSWIDAVNAGRNDSWIDIESSIR